MRMKIREPVNGASHLIGLLLAGAGTILLLRMARGPEQLAAFAIYGGNFGRENVQTRLEPQHIQFPPLSAMTPEEQTSVGAFAGQQVTTGNQAEAFSRYIAGHLEAVNDGATYSETSAAARAEGLAPDVAAELQGKADTLFKGETLRSMLLNAYGWWTVATIALFVGYAMVAMGFVLAGLAAFGFRHANRTRTAAIIEAPATVDAKVLVNA